MSKACKNVADSIVVRVLHNSKLGDGIVSYSDLLYTSSSRLRDKRSITHMYARPSYNE